MPNRHLRAERFALQSLFGRPNRLLLVSDAVFVPSGAILGSVRDTTGAAKVGGYYEHDLTGSSIEFMDFACFCASERREAIMRIIAR